MIRQLSEEWFRLRAGKITASIAAACLGLDPYCSRQRAWRKILGQDKPEHNRHTQWGTRFECLALTDYEVLSGTLVEETGFVVHPRLPWLGASPDGLIGADGLGEVKCPGQAPASVPIPHRIQILVQLMCTGRFWGDYWAWVDRDYFIQRVYPAGFSWLERNLEKFYVDFVLTKTEPPKKNRRKKEKKNGLERVAVASEG